MNERTLHALSSLAVAAVEELRDLRDPDPLAAAANRAVTLAAITIERHWLPNLAVERAGD